MRWIPLFRSWEKNCSDFTPFLACDWFKTKAGMGHGEFLLQLSPKGYWWSELILTQLEDSETFDFILALFCFLSVLYQQFRVFLTLAFLPLILASPLGVSCVFAKETKTIDFAAGWVCLCFLHTVCSPARCYLKAVFKVTLGDFLDGTWTQHQMPPSHPARKLLPFQPFQLPQGAGLSLRIIDF